MVIVLLFTLLFIKHFIFDFPFQTTSELEHKGTFGDPRGMLHSYKHMVGTIVVFAFFTPYCALYATGDFVSHYLIDLSKMKASKGLTPADKKFWNYLGFDQLLHNLVYALMVLIYIHFKKKGL